MRLTYNEAMKEVKQAILTIRTVKNWYDLVPVRLGLNDQIILKYCNGLKIPIKKGAIWRHYFLASAILELSSAGCTFLDEGTIALPMNIKFRYPHSDAGSIVQIYEIFFRRIYELLDVRNKTVVDVGSSIGDSPIYFALRGAVKVYAYEPLREIFPYLLENIKFNKMENTIFPSNVAISSTSRRIFLKVDSEWLGASHTDCAKKGQGYWVDAQPLPLDADVLKMDCEGGEYDILSSIPHGSMKFKEIMLEFHSGSQQLVKILTQEGYSIEALEKHNNSIGLLYAKLKSD